MHYAKIATSSTRHVFWHLTSATLVALTALWFALPANAQYFCFPPSCSKVTGWDANPSVDQTVQGNQAESVCNVSKRADGVYVELVAYNEDSPSIQFTPDDRLVPAGAANGAYSYRAKSASNPNPGWQHVSLSPPVSSPPNPLLDWATLWGDPSVTSNPELPHVVFLTLLGIPQTKFDLLKNPDDNMLHGIMTDSTAGYPIGGACIFRSTDDGQTFSSVGCVKDTSDLGFPNNQYGHFFDGSSTAVAQRDDGPGYSAYVAFHDYEAGWDSYFRMDDATSTVDNPLENPPFHLDHTAVGPNPAQYPIDMIGNPNIDIHVRLVPRGQELWKMSVGLPRTIPSYCTGIPKTLNLNIRNRNRDAQSFDFDIGFNEDGEPEMRYVYISGNISGNPGVGPFKLQGGFCPVENAVNDDKNHNVLAECQDVTVWSTQPESEPMVFFPTVKYAEDPVSHMSAWKVTFQGRTPQNTTQLAVFAAELVRNDKVPDSGTFRRDSGLVLTQVAPFQTPCPDVRSGADPNDAGYWGDYDKMVFDELSGKYVRSITDSSLGCDTPRSRFTSHNVHVSTVYLPLRPPIPLDGFQYRGVQQQVKYVNYDGHVYELYLTEGDSQWYKNDLTTETEATTTVAMNSGILAFESTYDVRQHVIYRASDNAHHLWEMVLLGNSRQWSQPPTDLTDLASHNGDAPVPRDGSPLVGYQTAFDEQVHVGYIPADGYPRELRYHTSLSPIPKHLWLETGRPQSDWVRAVNLVGYVTPNNQQHMIMSGEDHSIYEFYLGTSDTHWDVRLVASAGLVFPGSTLNAYVTTKTSPVEEWANFIAVASDNKPHVIAIMKGQGDTSWGNAQVLDQPAASPCSQVSPSSPLAGYETTYNNQQHVDFVDTQNRVCELVKGGIFPVWTPRCLTDEARDINGGGPVPHVASDGSGLVGYQSTFENPDQQHVVFTTNERDVYELFWDNGWKGNNLTQRAVPKP